MATIESNVHIHRPIEEVFRFISDPRNAPKWAHKVREVIIDRPMGVGTRGQESRSFLGRNMTMEWVISEYEANRKITFRYTTGPVPMVASFTFEPVADGTTISCHTNIEGRGIFRLLVPLIALEGKNEDAANFRNLKSVLEEMKPESPSVHTAVALKAEG